MDYTPIGDDGMAALAPGLLRCHSLKHLSLTSTGLSAQSAGPVASILLPSLDPIVRAAQPQLTALSLSWNAFRASGVLSLCSAIAAAPALQVLLLGSVGLVREDGVGAASPAAVLASAAVKCQALQYLDIDGNDIGVRSTANCH